MNLDNTPSRVNREAQKKRHERLRFISPLLKDWDAIERQLPPREKKMEKHFFWRITSLSTFFFFLLSLLPQFFVTAEEFWSTPFEPQPVSFEGYDIGLVDEGFLLKPELVDAEGDRTGLETREYVVEPGDTLSEIATKHGVTPRTIMQNNKMYDANDLKSGQVLQIPPVDGVVHEVEKGDTLSKIATKYKVGTEKIIAQNNLTPGADLTVGEQLTIPGAIKALPTPPPPKVPTYSPPAGASSSALAASVGRLLKPANGTYTQYFHWGHWAVDIAGAAGSPIYAARDGTVERASYGWNGGYGNMIVIDHGGGVKTLYGHNSKLYVTPGQWITKGQPIAAMGNTGRVYGVTGVHSHFEVHVNGRKENPLKYF